MSPRRLGWALALAALPACTFAPGTAFTHLDAAALRVALEPGAARDLGDHTVLTDDGEHVEVFALTVTVDRAALVRLEGAGAAQFDPANPPEGYTLCHGGHCHADDGSLVSYTDIQLELSGGRASLVDVVELPGGEPFDALDGSPRRVDATPEDLDAGGVSDVQVALAHVFLQAEATGGALTAPVPLTLDLAVDQTVSWPVADLVIDRSLPAHLTLEVSWVVDGTLFDPLDLAGATGPIALSDPEDPAAAAFLEALLLNPPAATWAAAD